MTYELAKKLKDAGFPQEKSEFFFVKWNSNEDRIGRCNWEFIHWNDKLRISPYEIMCDAPSLSDLVKACGVPFMLQTHDGIVWQAFHDTHTITLDPVGKGSDPEEAAANLWLAIKQNVQSIP